MPELAVTSPLDACTAHSIPSNPGAPIVTVTVEFSPTTRSGCENAMVDGNVYAGNAHVTRALLFDMISVAVGMPDESLPVYVVASVNAPVDVKATPSSESKPRLSPKRRLCPVIESTTLATDIPWTNVGLG
jgi:hypothetical protein